MSSGSDNEEWIIISHNEEPNTIINDYNVESNIIRLYSPEPEPETEPETEPEPEIELSKIDKFKKIITNHPYLTGIGIIGIGLFCFKSK